MSNCFILLAAGKGKRFKSNTPKQFADFKNKPLFMHSIEKATKSNLFKEILVANKDADQGYLEVSQSGLARVTFTGPSYTATYYLVQLQSA